MSNAYAVIIKLFDIDTLADSRTGCCRRTTERRLHRIEFELAATLRHSAKPLMPKFGTRGQCRRGARATRKPAQLGLRRYG
jgi:hypothetical protein